MTAPTRAAIMAASPAQLRLRCAEYVMGYEWKTCKYTHYAHGRQWIRGENILTLGDDDTYIPDYSNDIAAAWTVHKKMVMVENPVPYFSELFRCVEVRTKADFQGWSAVLALMEPVDTTRAALLAVCAVDDEKENA